MEIKIILVDDHKMLRDGLRTVIEKNSIMKIVGEAADGREAVALIIEKAPDVVVMDIAMPGLNGVEATAQIIEKNPNVKIIALSMHSNKRFVMGMLKAGAFGYLLKDSDSDELITAIKTVHANQKYISQKISSIIVNEFLSPSDEEDYQLTTREKEILQLLAEGKTSKEIAELLFLSSKTVDTHRKNIMDKLDMHSLPELTKYAIRSGLTMLDD